MYANPVDPYMATVYYPPTPPMPYMVSPPSSNFFILPTTTAMLYSEGFISSPASYSIPTAAIQPSPAPAQLPSDDVVKIFENFTCSSPPTSPQMTDKIQQPVSGSNTVDNNTVSE